MAKKNEEYYIQLNIKYINEDFLKKPQQQALEL